MMTIEKLYEKYYSLYGNLFASRNIFPNDKVYNFFAEGLFDRFKQELDVCNTEYVLDEGSKMFELKFKAANYIPRRTWLWRFNRTAKALRKLFIAEFNNYLANLELGKTETKVDTQDVRNVASTLKETLHSPKRSVLQVTTSLPVQSDSTQSAVAPCNEDNSLVAPSSDTESK